MARKFSTGLLLLSALLFSARTVRAGDQDFVIVNKTGVEIHKIFVTPHDVDHWGERYSQEGHLPR